MVKKRRMREEEFTVKKHPLFSGALTDGRGAFKEDPLISRLPARPKPLPGQQPAAAPKPEKPAAASKPAGPAASKPAASKPVVSTGNILKPVSEQKADIRNDKISKPANEPKERTRNDKAQKPASEPIADTRSDKIQKPASEQKADTRNDKAQKPVSEPVAVSRSVDELKPAKELKADKRNDNEPKPAKEAKAGIRSDNTPKAPQVSAPLAPRPAAVSEEAAPAVKRDPLERPLTMILAAVACVIFTAALCVFLPFYFDGIRSDVTVNDNGFKVSVGSHEKDVATLLERMGIELSPYDMMDVERTDELYDGMEIVIRRAMHVSVEAGSDVTPVYVVSGTVGDALAAANITLTGEDEVYPGYDEYLTPGMQVQYIQVEKELITESEAIGFQTRMVDDGDMWVGQEKVTSEGAEGLKEVITEITYKNGNETARERVSSDVIVAPVDEVVHVGTMVVKKTEMGYVNQAGRLLQTPSVSKIYSDSWYEHRKQPKPDASIIAYTVIARNVTAYTHTGRRTASGLWPQVGTVATYWKSLAKYGGGKYTKIYVPGYGYGRIEDQGEGTDSGAIDLDLFMETKSDCRSWGRKRNYKFYILKG